MRLLATSIDVRTTAGPTTPGGHAAAFGARPHPPAPSGSPGVALVAEGVGKGLPVTDVPPRPSGVTGPIDYPAPFLVGSARQLQRDQLGAYRGALELGGGCPVRFRLGPPRVGIRFDTVFRPEDARQILATDAAHYDKQLPIMDEFRRVIGDGLITSEGDRWRTDRRTIAPLFTPKQITSYVDTMAAAAGQLVVSWAPAAEAGREVDVHAGAVRYTLEVLGRTIIGDDIDELAPLFAETVPMLSEYATRRALSPVRLPASWPTPANRRAASERQRLFAAVSRMIERRRAGPGDGTDLLSRLLAVRDPETGAALDDVAVRDQVLTFLIAGHETSASAMAMALWLLGSHREVQDRVRQEVRAVCAAASADRGEVEPGGPDGRAGPGGIGPSEIGPGGAESGAQGVVGAGSIGPGEVGQMTFTGQVVQEALRLYSPSHTVVRRVSEACQVAGYDVTAGHLMAVSVWGIHHNPAVWPDPDRFDPDRFGAASDGGAGRYGHLSFGGGPRGCIGEQLARDELIVGLATIVAAYRLGAPAETPPLDVGVTLRPAGPVMCRLRPA